MYDIEKLMQNYNPSLKSHEQYFILRWSELLEGGPLHFRKLINPCTRALISEFIGVTNLFNAGVLKIYNINNAAKELKIALKNDKIIKGFLNNDYTFIIGKLSNFISQLTSEQESSNAEENKRLIKEIDIINEFIKAFLNKLESKNIIELYSIYFREHLPTDSYSYSKIDRELSMLISELLYEGNSKAYLYRWGAGVFVYDREKTTLIEKLERLGQDLGKKNLRTFKCYLQANLPNIYDFWEKLEGKIKIFKDSNEARLGLEEISQNALEKSVNDYFNIDNSLKILQIEIEAADEEAAINQARILLLTKLSLINLDKKSKVYIPSVKNRVVLLDTRSNNISIRTDNDDGDGIKIAKFSDYLHILFTANENKYKSLNRLMGWLRVVQDSPKETALVAMWSMMELLFVHDYSDKNNKVISQAKPYISHYFAKNMVVKATQILKTKEANYNLLKEKIKEEYGDVALRRQDNNIKLEYLLDYIKLHENEVLNVYDNLILEQRYIQYLNSFTTVVKERKHQAFIHLKGYILQLEENMDNDLARAYRIRNILAHEASIQSDFFEDIYEKMVFYLQIILDDILFSMIKQNKNTIEQLTMIKEESYKQYIKHLDNVAKVLLATNDDLKDKDGEVMDEEKESQKTQERLDIYKGIVNTKNLLI
ncbi:hypothetical protein C2I06_18475 [Niallia circulans]|uniref:hypothetical protein n=1 Tax=Niallia circulans TaxID=1397 RepID=UPI000F45AA5A|nr:hypothetical protein [Niallia circulans]AYV68707.1 hypothetical protein C2I06_18475 [Niallia circulans]